MASYVVSMRGRGLCQRAIVGQARARNEQRTESPCYEPLFYVVDVVKCVTYIVNHRYIYIILGIYYFSISLKMYTDLKSEIRCKRLHAHLVYVCRKVVSAIGSQFEVARGIFKKNNREVPIVYWDR